MTSLYFDLAADPFYCPQESTQNQARKSRFGIRQARFRSGAIHSQARSSKSSRHSCYPIPSLRSDAGS